MDQIAEIIDGTSMRARVFICRMLIGTLNDSMQEKVMRLNVPANETPESVQWVYGANHAMEQALAAMLAGD